MPEPLRQALGRCRGQLHNLGRQHRDRFFSDLLVHTDQERDKVARWNALVVPILRWLARPDAGGRRPTPRPGDSVLPVLHPSNRRAMMRATWDSLLPWCNWPSSHPSPGGTVQIYLDVSVSMTGEIQAMAALLDRFHGWVRRPLWAFSEAVFPADLRQGKLFARTTQGTCLDCVIQHIRQTRPHTALVVTDGEIGIPPPAESALPTRIHCLITPVGTAKYLEPAGYRVTLLPRLH